MEGKVGPAFTRDRQVGGWYQYKRRFLHSPSHIVPLLHVVVTYGAYTFLQKKTISGTLPTSVLE